MGNIHKFAADWTDLGDTPAGITADQFVRGNGAGTALVFFDLFGSANTWSADQTHTADALPGADQTENVGTDAARWLSVRGRFGQFVGTSTAGGGEPPGGSGTRTTGANPTGIMAGNQVQATGAATHYLRGGQFKAVACCGNVHTGGTGVANLSNRSGGSSLFGSAYAVGNGEADVEATSFGNFTTAYAYPGGGNTHRFSNRGAGAFLAGYSQGGGAVDASVTGAGAFMNVRPVASGASATCNALASGNGAFCQGFLQASNTATTTMTASGSGAFAQGRSENQLGTGGTLRATGVGAFAQGLADGVSLEATNAGAFAQGRAVANNITASGLGSFAHGDSTSAAIVASATNSAQLGPGTNALANSLQVGNAGLRLKGDTGAPGALQNGDIWVASGFVYIRSNGVSVQI